MGGRQALPAVHAHQRVLLHGDVELEELRLVDEELGTPEDPGGHLLHGAPPYIHLPRVDGVVLLQEYAQLPWGGRGGVNQKFSQQPADRRTLKLERSHWAYTS